MGVSIVATIAVVALVGPYFARYDPNAVDILSSLEPPSAEHWFGTDDVGRDVFTRAIYGTRMDLLVVLLVTAAGFVIGTIAGALAAFRGGWPDTVISRVGDTMVAIPFLVVILVVVAVLGVGLTSVCIGILLVSWAFYARLARTQVLTVNQQEYVLAAHALGFTRRRVLLRHVLPNAVQPGLVYATIDAVSNLVAIAAMSYLGFGTQPPSADLGSIIAGGQSYLLSAWWISTLPALVLVALGIGIGLIGDGFIDRDYSAAQ